MIASRLEGPFGLTERRSTFTRRDVMQAWCERLPAGTEANVADIERLADDFLRSPCAVVLAEGERSEPLRRHDGRLVPAAGVERTYSTPELLALEQRIIEYATERRSARVGLATSRAIERAIERRPLQESARIPSTSVTALLQDLVRRPFSTIAPRSVLVVDEAAMVPTRELAQLVDHLRRLDVKLVLVGDHRQLPAIGAGGAFGGLLTRLPVIELEENRRQELQWERDALRLARSGAAHEAVQRYDQAGRIDVGKDAAELRQRLVADWWAERDPGGSLMIAQRRVDVADLNGRAHALMRSAGALGGEEMRVAGTPFSVGDHVVLRRNDRALRIVNGDRGVVTGVAPAEGRIELRLGGRQVSLTREYLEQPTRHGTPALTHGYAITGHLAQGMTCRSTFILATDELTREAGYVALSRGRESNRVYALQPAAPERAEYAPAAGREKDARAALVDAPGSLEGADDGQ